MNCTEFHQQLPYYIESGGNPEAEEHLKMCPNCADLVADLRYIAEQAKLLLPMRDPSPNVWQNIKRSLENEGLNSPSRMPLGALERIPTQSKSWGAVTWVAAAAVIIIAIGLFAWRGTDSSTPAQTAGNAAPPAASDDLPNEDVQLLQTVAQRRPSLRPVYESNLKNVNSYIKQVKQMVDRNPADAEAREYLMQAYAQKAMLYEMAMSRSME